MYIIITKKESDMCLAKYKNPTIIPLLQLCIALVKPSKIDRI